MSGNRTYTMVKPTAMRKGYMAAIMNKIAEGGFKIVAAKMTQLSKAEAEAFYAIHKNALSLVSSQNLCHQVQLWQW
jgi:nucleoside-diphosphate kinase